jgi:hypothetical protein
MVDLGMDNMRQLCLVRILAEELQGLHRACLAVHVLAFGLIARVAEWQTRWIQNPLSERACGFKSHLGYKKRTHVRKGQ